jgi:rhodanese-related sulfurtransferase
MNNSEQKAKYHTIEPDLTLDMIKKNDDFYLVDVRTDEEFNFGHLEKSINIPLNEIRDKAEQSFKTKDSKIVIYCKSGARSKLAASELIYLGYRSVYDLGGIVSYPYELTM